MQELTEQDALAIRAYLNTVPAVHNAVQANQLPFPFNVRTGYLAEGLAHCGMCHTSRAATRPRNACGATRCKAGSRQHHQ